ncbi:hypothetical protein K439DRAFT_1377173, partial [Ramaria rubella]
LALGMKVMVTTSVDTDLDVANGSHGVIVGITLDPREEQCVNSQIVKLEYPPSYILVQLQRTRTEQLEGLEEGVIPIEPAKKSFKIQAPLTRMKRTQKTVKQIQLPLTAAYAFTDYRSQGQTIPHIIVDIGIPPSGGKLSMFNLYVALSRSSGQETVQLLRDFNENIFMQELGIHLELEDQRLRELNEKMKDWWGSMCRDSVAYGINNRDEFET